MHTCAVHVKGKMNFRKDKKVQLVYISHGLFVLCNFLLQLKQFFWMHMWMHTWTKYSCFSVKACVCCMCTHVYIEYTHSSAKVFTLLHRNCMSLSLSFICEAFVCVCGVEGHLLCLYLHAFLFVFRTPSLPFSFILSFETIFATKKRHFFSPTTHKPTKLHTQRDQLPSWAAWKNDEITLGSIKKKVITKTWEIIFFVIKLTNLWMRWCKLGEGKGGWVWHIYISQTWLWNLFKLYVCTCASLCMKFEFGPIPNFLLLPTIEKLFPLFLSSGLKNAM